MSTLSEAGIFLIKTLFSLYIFLMVMRIILQWVHATVANPLVQGIATLTNPPLKIIRKILPIVHGFDLAAFVLLVLLEWIKIILVALLATGSFPHVMGLIVLAFAEIFDLFIVIYLYGIFIFVILSWIYPVMGTPVMTLLYQITEPILRPIRRLIPPIAGLDLSPIGALILLKLIQILITEPLLYVGMGMAAQAI